MQVVVVNYVAYLILFCLLQVVYALTKIVWKILSLELFKPCSHQNSGAQS